ncbi:nuclear transport factor 2 family protein [Amycolatopsis sp. cmx-4-83]|uniref:nuclear transport factor 2 family protein n=1 Tax=Amycolatopsis sp. cmx-4-83 TaxID=2790940 RepID=UPI003979AAEB
MTIVDPEPGLPGVLGSPHIAQVAQVVITERQARDRGWWKIMSDQYWPDSTVHLSWYDGDGSGFVAGSAAMARRGATALHRMFTPAVHVRGDKAYVEAPVTMRLAVDADGIAGNLTSYTRLNYRLARRDDRWRILSLNAIYENATLAAAVPGEQIVIPAAELGRFRESYALLAWNAARLGGSPSDNELGDDRPEEVAEFYAGTWQWLTAG